MTGAKLDGVSCPLLPGACVPCTGATPPLSSDERESYELLVPDWISDELHTMISRTYGCKNYADAVAFLVSVTVIAEREGHHPDFRNERYRFLVLTLTTHAIHDLSVNDFVVARMIDEAWIAHNS